jgi:hypothetical protein
MSRIINLELLQKRRFKHTPKKVIEDMQIAQDDNAEAEEWAKDHFGYNENF